MSLGLFSAFAVAYVTQTTIYRGGPLLGWPLVALIGGVLATVAQADGHRSTYDSQIVFAIGMNCLIWSSVRQISLMKR